MIVLGLDLKRASSNCNPARHSLARGIDEQRQAGVLACHSACAADDVSPVRRTLWWGAQGQELFLARAISLHGLCPTDYRESVPDIDACLRAQAGTLYHMGIKSRVSRSTLADADEVRDWRLYAEFSQMLIGIARRLHVWELFGIDLKDTAYALDASTIDLCLSVFPWAPFRSTKVAVKLHTLWDLRGNLLRSCTSATITARCQCPHLLLPEPGAFYVMDRGYLDFERLHGLHDAASFFVIRAKSNLQAHRRYWRPVDRSTGVDV